MMHRLPGRRVPTPGPHPAPGRLAPARLASSVLAAVGALSVVAMQAAPAFASPAVPAAPAVSSAAPTSAPAGHGWIRFAHFAPDNGPVRVTVDGHTLVSDATFETVTAYRSVSVGAHTVTLTDVDAPHTSLSDHLAIANGGADTIGAIQNGHGIRLQRFDDDLAPGPAGDARVRIVDTAPTEQKVQVTLQRNASPGTATETAFHPRSSAPVPGRLSVAAPSVLYGKAGAYLDVAAGTYTVVVKNAAGRAIITGHNWPVTADTVASLVIVQAKSAPTLEVLRDAAGSSTPPVGGMETGFGGEAGVLAGSSHPGGSDTVDLVGVLLLVGAVGLVVSEILRGAGRRRRVVVSVVAVAGVACTSFALVGSGGQAGSAGRTSARPALATGGAPSPVVARGATSVPVIGHGTTVDLAGRASAPAVAPTSLTIASIGVRTSLVKLGRTADGQAQVPTTTKVAGWYKGGPAPGQPGPAVILGHVDSYSGPGVFFGLHELQPGALVTVVENGRTLSFAVQAVRSYDKTHFPTAAVFGPTPDRALRLVTCGGRFDYTTRHYEQNVVVYATEVGAGVN